MNEEWEIRKLNEVCEVRPSKRQVKKKLDEDAFVTYAPMGDLGIDQKYFSGNEERTMGDAYKGYTYFEEGDVVLAKITPCFENGKLGIARNLENGIGFGSTEFIPYRTGDELMSEYLYYYLSQPSFRKEGERLMTGAVGHKRLPKDFYEEYEIPVPPIDEQKRIVSILDEAFEAIDQARANIERNIKNAEELFESKLDNMFTQKGDGWEEKTLGDIAKVKGGKRLPKGKSLVSTPTDYPYIRVSDFNDDGSIDLDSVQYLTKDIYEEIKKYTITDKDLYISIAGTIGKSGIVPSSLNGTNLTENACKLVFNDNVFNEFVLYFTFSGLFKKQAGLNTRTTAQPKLTLKRVKTIKLGIPKLEEQKRIVRYLKSLHDKKNELDELYQQKLTSLRELKSSILQQVFSGELTKKEELVA